MDTKNTQRIQLSQRIEDLRAKAEKVLNKPQNCRCCNIKLPNFKNSHQNERDCFSKTTSILTGDGALEAKQKQAVADKKSHFYHSKASTFTANEFMISNPLPEDIELQRAHSKPITFRFTSPQLPPKRQSLNRDASAKQKELRVFLDQILTKAKEKVDKVHRVSQRISNTKIEPRKLFESHYFHAPFTKTETQSQIDTKSTLQKFLGDLRAEKMRFSNRTGNLSCEHSVQTEQLKQSKTVAESTIEYAENAFKKNKHKSHVPNQVFELETRSPTLHSKRSKKRANSFSISTPWNIIQKLDQNLREAEAYRKLNLLASLNSKLETVTDAYWTTQISNFLVAIETERVQMNLAVLAQICQ